MKADSPLVGLAGTQKTPHHQKGSAQEKMPQRKFAKKAFWQSKLINGSDVLAARKANAVLINADARELLTQLPKESVDCIITSPPYGALKDYGSQIQIGYGQHYKNQYLPDLDGVLGQLYRVAKRGAALWLVLDTIKNNGESLLLPWELAQRAQKCGWTLHDVVVWDKGRSLPWSHKGRFRGVCEFMILLGKGKLKTYNLSAVRDHEDLSAYWVKYPERFNPEGKAPTDLWHFPIPVQGSWSKKTLRHFCPFPTALVSRILAISTKKGDLVLDPFSGTGSVVAIAAASNRLGVGIELNPAFVKTFNTSGYDAFVNEIKRTRIATGGKSLSQLLQKLRLLKYPKSLFVQIARDDRIGAGAEAAIAAFVVRDPRLNHAGNVWAAARVDVLINNSKEASRIQREISTCVTVPPLSKFGVKIDIHVLPPKKWNSTRYRASLKKEFWYRYANGRFYQFTKKIRKSDLRFVKSTGRLTQNRKYPDIVSSLPLQLASFD